MKKSLFWIILVMLFFSCSIDKNETLIVLHRDNRDSYDDVIVKTGGSPLFADINGFLGIPSVKSSGNIEPEGVSLESLLNRNNTESTDFNGISVNQIPFSSNITPPEVRLVPQDSTDITDSSPIKKFLVEYKDSLSSDWTIYVATMIENSTTEHNESLSFINRGDFNGVILYSAIDGTLLDVIVYQDQPLVYGNLSLAENNSSESEEGLSSLTLTTGSFSSDDDEYNTLNPSYCIAYIDDSNQSSLDKGNYCRPILGYVTPVIGGDVVGIGGGGIKDPITYYVNLDVCGNGSTSGQGVYQPRTSITIDAYPFPDNRFDRWWGDFDRQPRRFSLTVTKNYHAIANFLEYADSTDIPCYNDSSKVSNPLVNMILAPSNSWSTNYKGATFGNTRTKKDGTTRPHKGLDLAAEPGTNIYSMYNGTVVKVVSDIPNGAVPNSSHNNAGNRISISSVVNNKTITISYFHLLAPNPIAVNRRTGVPFKEGDTVYQGELIGVSGRTGNAYNVANAHLHLAIKENGVFVDPADYINGKIYKRLDNGEVFVDSTTIYDIVCDDQFYDFSGQFDWFNLPGLGLYY